MEKAKYFEKPDYKNNYDHNVEDCFDGTLHGNE
jgi:hypothetical protein